MAIELTYERLEEIKESVVDMYEKFDIKCAPISSFDIAIKMGIKVIPYSAYSERIQKLMLEESKDGFVAINNGKFCICYNDETNNSGRINNTIMHEIGHVVLEHSQDSKLAEKEVKFFAKYALAPPVLVHKLELKDEYSISKAFDISFKAARYALAYYNKWLVYGDRNYTSYELKILELFKEAI